MERRGQAWPGGGGAGWPRDATRGDPIPVAYGWHRPGSGKSLFLALFPVFKQVFVCVGDWEKIRGAWLS